jgi:hypothetical protein
MVPTAHVIRVCFMIANHKQPSGSGEDRPNHFQRAQIDGTTFAIGNRSLAWMIEPPSHGLKPRAVAHRRKSAAKVSSDDFRLLVQEVDCPNKIRQQKPTVLPVGDCIAISKAIQVYGHINCRGPDRLYESCKSRLPIRSRYWMQPVRVIVLFGSPWSDPQAPGAARGSITPQAPRKTALKVSATPNSDLLYQRVLQRPINPRGTRPLKRTHNPIRMIIERQYYERFFYLTNKNRRQVMKISRPGKGERPKNVAKFCVKPFDHSLRSNESQRGSAS